MLVVNLLYNFIRKEMVEDLAEDEVGNVPLEECPQDNIENITTVDLIDEWT